MNFPQSISLNITAQDIVDGRKNSCERCPAALAACRVFPDGHVEVTVQSLYVDPPEGTGDYFAIYDGGSALRDFTQAFDHDNPVTPVIINMYRNDTHSSLPEVEK